MGGNGGLLLSSLRYRHRLFFLGLPPVRCSRSQKSGMAEDREWGAMLPDELWVLVFSHLDTAGALLDVVALVCKRWRGLARDARSWAGVSVKENVDWMDPSSQPRAFARAILHAPGLRCLDLLCTGRTFSTEVRLYSNTPHDKECPR